MLYYNELWEINGMTGCRSRAMGFCMMVGANAKTPPYFETPALILSRWPLLRDAAFAAP